MSSFLNHEAVETAVRQYGKARITIFRHSLTKRLELLRENRARAGSLRASERYRARAEVYRLQAETFRDPKARAQMLQLAAICDREAIQAEQFEIRQ